MHIHYSILCQMYVFNLNLCYMKIIRAFESKKLSSIMKPPEPPIIYIFFNYLCFIPRSGPNSTTSYLVELLIYCSFDFSLYIYSSIEFCPSISSQA